jgi:hypothetical protein
VKLLLACWLTAIAVLVWLAMPRPLVRVGSGPRVAALFIGMYVQSNTGRIPVRIRRAGATSLRQNCRCFERAWRLNAAWWTVVCVISA